MGEEEGRALTNEEFGKRIGVTHSMASRLRAGKRLPSVTVLRSISREFGIPAKDLLDAHNRGAGEFGALIRARCFRIGKKERASA